MTIPTNRRRRHALACCTVLGLIISAFGPSSASSQTAQPAPSRDPSERLEKSDGVIRPPPDVDPKMTVKPPDPTPGSMPVIPPPGSPGGNPNVVPK
jgi:hypothetical protein